MQVFYSMMCQTHIHTEVSEQPRQPFSVASARKQSVRLEIFISKCWCTENSSFCPRLSQLQPCPCRSPQFVGMVVLALWLLVTHSGTLGSALPCDIRAERLPLWASHFRHRLWLMTMQLLLPWFIMLCHRGQWQFLQQNALNLMKLNWYQLQSWKVQMR